MSPYADETADRDLDLKGLKVDPEFCDLLNKYLGSIAEHAADFLRLVYKECQLIKEPPTHHGAFPRSAVYYEKQKIFGPLLVEMGLLEADSGKNPIEPHYVLTDRGEEICGRYVPHGNHAVFSLPIAGCGALPMTAE